jgi:hypothetical protein
VALYTGADRSGIARAADITAGVWLLVEPAGYVVGVIARSNEVP